MPPTGARGHRIEAKALAVQIGQMRLGEGEMRSAEGRQQRSRRSFHALSQMARLDRSRVGKLWWSPDALEALKIRDRPRCPARSRLNESVTDCVAHNTGGFNRIEFSI
jgi:hypothetical protein